MIDHNQNKTSKNKGFKKKPNHSPYQPYAIARFFAISLGLSNRDQWRSYSKGEMNDLPCLPLEIPKNPDQTYKDTGWEGWKHWLGTDMVKMKSHDKDSH